MRSWAIAVATIVGSSAAHAQMPAKWNTAAVTTGVDFQTTGSGTTMTWSSTGVWNGGIVADGAGKTVSLEPRMTAAMTVTVDGTYTVGSLTSRNNNSTPIKFTGTGKLIFDNGSNPSIWDNNSRTTRFTNLRPDIYVDIQLNSDLDIRMGAARSEEAGVGRIGKTISGDGALTLTLGQNDGATNRLFKIGEAGANTYTGGTEIRHIVSISGTGQYGESFGSSTNNLLVKALSTGTFGTGDVVLNSTGLSKTVVTALTAAASGSSDVGGIQMVFSANNVMGSAATLTQSGDGAGLVLMGTTQQTIAGLVATGTDGALKRINSTSAALTIDTLAAASSTYNGIILGGTSLEIKGSGTQVLSNANTYTGATKITAGTLLLGSGGSITSNATVSADAAFGGDGAMTGTATFNDASIFAWNLSITDPADSASANTGDTFDVTGALTDGGSTGDSVFKILLGGSQTFADNFWTASHSWTNVLTSTSGVSLATLFTSFSYANASNSITAPTTGSFSFTGSTLNYSAVPEVSNLQAGLLLGAGLLRRRRRA